MYARATTSAVLITLGQSVSAECSYCAQEVTFSKDLAGCFLEEIEQQFETAASLNLEVHLVDLSPCVNTATTRNLTMPTPKLSDTTSNVPISTSFLISVPAMECLAKALENERFEPENVKTFEVRGDCQK